MQVHEVIKLWIDKTKISAAKVALSEVVDQDPPIMNEADLEILHKAMDVLQRHAIEKLYQLEELADKDVTTNGQT